MSLNHSFYDNNKINVSAALEQTGVPGALS